MGLEHDRCSLVWGAPDDDGGSPVKHYIVEKMNLKDGLWKEVKKVDKPECDVLDLVEGDKYKFRVRAVNDQGESENLINDKEILARDQFDPPDPPTDLNLTNWDSTFADLEWGVPQNDNGSPVLKYIIQAKVGKATTWSNVKEVKHPDHATKIENLTPNSEYQFRVIAVNKAGPSEPSEVSKPIIAKPRFRKYLLSIV